MTTGAGLDHLQVGLVAALRVASEVQALCGQPARVYDDVPNSTGPVAPVFPYIALGAASEDASNAEGYVGADFTYQINVWSRAGGSIEAKQVVKAVRRALHEQSITLAEGRCVFIHWAGSQYFPSPDGETYQAQVTFRGHVTYKE